MHYFALDALDTSCKPGHGTLLRGRASLCPRLRVGCLACMFPALAVVAFVVLIGRALLGIAVGPISDAEKTGNGGVKRRARVQSRIAGSHSGQRSSDHRHVYLLTPGAPV